MLIGPPPAPSQCRRPREALPSGKSDYCEKPMVHDIEDGHDGISAQRESGKTFQVAARA